MSDKRAGRAPAQFDDAAFSEDLKRTSDTGRKVAFAVRSEYEQDGVPIGDLLACEEEGPEGTALAHCMKVYLPRPDGRGCPRPRRTLNGGPPAPSAAVGSVLGA
jgi:hypothetical protein